VNHESLEPTSARGELVSGRCSRELKDAPTLPAPLPFLARHIQAWLTLAAVTFILLTGLTPFDVQQFTGGVQSNGLFVSTINHATLPDTVANIFLYVPLGLLLCLSLSRLLGGRVLGLLGAIILSGFISFGIEWVQAYSPARVSSLIDLYANCAGGVIGAMLALAARSIGPRLVASAMVEVSLSPISTMMRAYCLVLIVVAAAPFSFVIDGGAFAREVSECYFVPFASYAVHDARATAALEAGSTDQYQLAKWDALRCWSRWAAEFASFAILAWLILATLRTKYGFSSSATVALTIWTGTGLAVGLSAIHLIVLTRHVDVTDILFRLMGLFVGTLATLGSVMESISAKLAAKTAVEERGDALKRLARLGCLGTAAYILYTGVIPWTFDSEEAGPAQAVAAQSFLPFQAYFFARFDLMVADVTEKFLSFGLLGVLAVIGWPALMPHFTGARVAIAAAFAACGSACVEIVQMYIPIRVTSLTDPILAAAGVAIGLICYENVLTFYRMSVATATGQMYRPSQRRQRLSPTDELIATLTEPGEDAPKEGTPERPRTGRRN
jgi:VanZ family protein